MRMTEEQFASYSKSLSEKNSKITARSVCPPFHVVAKGIEPSLYAGMNETEKEYAQILEARKARGEILWWRYERYTFKLANNTRYTPDFAVMLPGGVIEFHEVKGGFIYEDSWIKLKIAASEFPHPFLLCQKQAKKDGGGWEVKEVKKE